MLSKWLACVPGEDVGEERSRNCLGKRCNMVRGEGVIGSALLPRGI